MQDKIRFFSPAEIVGVLQNTPTTLNALLQNLPYEVYAYHPGDGRWCAKEVVGHLIEEDCRDFLGRIRAMLDFDEPVLTINDQDEVARARRD